MFLLKFIKFKLIFLKLVSACSLNFYSVTENTHDFFKVRLNNYNLCLGLIFGNLYFKDWLSSIIKLHISEYLYPYNMFRYFSWKTRNWRINKYILKAVKNSNIINILPHVKPIKTAVGNVLNHTPDHNNFNFKLLNNPNSLIEYSLLKEGIAGFAYPAIRTVTKIKKFNFNITNPVFRNQLRLDQRYDRSFVILPRKIFLNQRKTKWLAITNQNSMKKILIYFNYIYNDRGGIYPNKLIFSEPSIMYNLRHIFTYFHSNTLRKFMLTNVHYKKWSTVVNEFNFSEGESGFFKLNKLKQSNILPINSLSYNYKKIIFDKYMQFKFAGIFWGTSYRLVSLLQNYFFSEVYFIFNKSLKKYVLPSKLASIFERIRKYRNPSNKPYFINEYIWVLFISFVSKDPQFLIRWIQKNVSRSPVNKQWVILRFLRATLKTTFPLFKDWFAIRGYRVVVKGKIGKTGSVRKKKIIIANGDYTFSDVFLKSDELGGIIQTETGSIGVRVMLTF